MIWIIMGFLLFFGRLRTMMKKLVLSIGIGGVINLLCGNGINQMVDGIIIIWVIGKDLEPGRLKKFMMRRSH
jgi:hypothetical protein